MASPSSITTTNVTATTEYFVDTPAAFVIGALCAVTGACMSLFTCSKHLRNYSQPDKQRNIVRILFIVPIYSIFSWFSLVFSDSAFFFITIRDVYEAYVIYCFLMLILAYGGGENNLCSEIARNPGAISHPPPLCKLAPIALGSRFLHSAKRYTLQFVITKPIFAIFSLIMLGLNQFDQAWYQTLLLIVYNISYTLALYWLVLFYLATKHLPQLKTANPVFKFCAVKIVVFATYYQQLLVQTLPGIPLEKLNRWNDFILCIEMVVFAGVHMYAFHWSEFSTSGDSSDMFHSMRDAADMKDVANDIRHSFRPKYDDYAMADGPDGPVRQDVSDQDMDKPPPRKLSGDGYDAPEMTATKTEEKQGTENIPVEVSVEVVVDASPL